jgi:hypothetical protein
MDHRFLLTKQQSSICTRFKKFRFFEAVGSDMGPKKLSKNYPKLLVIQVCAFYINTNVLLRFVTLSAHYKNFPQLIRKFQKKLF